MQLLGSRGQDKQSTMHEFDPKTGIIFYAEIMKNGVGCWNSKKTEFSALNHGQVAMDPNKMIYPSDLTVRAAVFFILNPMDNLWFGL